MTATRSTFSATTPRSWLISTSAMPVSRRMPASRSRICAWMVASSAVVGSSAISRSGCAGQRHGDHDALVHARPKAGADSRSSRRLASAMPTWSSSRSASASRRRAREAAMQLQRLAELPADAMHRIEAARRVLEDHGDALAAHALEQPRRRADQLLAVEAHRAADTGARRQQAERRQPGHALARARFADDARAPRPAHRQIDAIDGARTPSFRNRP